MLPIRTILVPTDFSDHSQAAFRLACSLAHDYGASIYLLHVTEPVAGLYNEGIVIPAPEALEAQLRDKLDQIQADKPAIPLERRLVSGLAADAILETARQIGADLIVLGTHGRTGLGRFLMGSVAEVVLRKATCPVLTVKKPLALKRDSQESLAMERDSAASPVGGSW
jgi:nucleotide-binding universal stress UspA family protein